jgi:TRAP-type C4-dicarboxylate transport system permease small subunit
VAGVHWLLSANWTVELARFLHVGEALLGGALAFRAKAHLGVQYFAYRLHPDARRVTAVIADLVVLFVAGAVLLFGSASMAREALARVGETAR